MGDRRGVPRSPRSPSPRWSCASCAAGQRPAPNRRRPGRWSRRSRRRCRPAPSRCRCCPSSTARRSGSAQTAAVVATRLGRAAESGRQEIDRGTLGERLTRFYEYAGSQVHPGVRAVRAERRATGRGDLSAVDGPDVTAAMRRAFSNLRHGAVVPVRPRSRGPALSAAASARPPCRSPRRPPLRLMPSGIDDRDRHRGRESPRRGARSGPAPRPA